MMKTLTFRKSGSILITFLGLFLLFSCEGFLSSEPEQPNPRSLVINNDFLIGSWQDSSELGLNFTLFEDGTARSDNMKTLLYKKWRKVGDEITFTIESIGNETSSFENVTYSIEKLSANRMVLSKNGKLTEYLKK